MTQFPQNGDAIRAIRQRDTMSLADLAARVGITRQALSHIELGNKGASPETLAKIAKELRVPLAAITIDGRDSELVSQDS